MGHPFWMSDASSKSVHVSKHQVLVYTWPGHVLVPALGAPRVLGQEANVYQSQGP